MPTGIRPARGQGPARLLTEQEGEPMANGTLIQLPNPGRGPRSHAFIENAGTRALAEAALAAAWAAGCHKARLASGSRQEATLRPYERAGSPRRENRNGRAPITVVAKAPPP